MTTLPVFVYEGFSYTIAKPFDLSSIVVSNSTGLPVGYFTSNLATGVTFSTTAASNILTAGTTEAFDITFSGTAGTFVSSNIVTIGAGRFTDLSGNSVNNNAYTFFNKEPIPAIKLQAPFTVGLATSVPTLPPGIKFFVSGSNVDISGTPLTTVPTSNYLLIGKSAVGSKVVTSTLNISISNERILYNLVGSPIISGLTVGTAIAPRSITATFPPYPFGGTLRYSWPSLPDGIQILDFNGNVVPTPQAGYFSTDPSHTLVVTGTPTINAAYDFSNISSNTISIQGLRTNPLPAITSNLALTFSFAETILFDLSTIPTLYTDVSLVTDQYFFRALTYFPSTSAITSIVSPDLRSDLSLNFNPSLSRANLVGKPLSPGSATYTIRATNTNSVTRDYLVPITVEDDVVTFVSPTPAIDTCYNFIFSRPVNLPKSGYYPSNIQFVATAASQLPVILSAPALDGTGLSLSATGVVSGLPTVVTGLTDLIVTATVTETSATASRKVLFEIVDDSFTFTDPPVGSFNFIQNKAITPFQIPVTTLSERPIIGYSSIGFPSGIGISPAGVVSGTPFSLGGGSVTIIPSTGYKSGSKVYSYTVQPDTVLFVVPQSSYQYAPSDPVDIQVTSIAYSGTTVSNFSLDLVPNYGLNIGSTSGNITGPWIDGVPPNVLPGTCNFAINCQAGGLDASLTGIITTFPETVNAALFVRFDPTLGGDGLYSNYVYYTPVSNLSSWTTAPEAIEAVIEGQGAISDVHVKVTTGLYSNVIIGVMNSSPVRVLRGTALLGFGNVGYSPSSDVTASAVINKTSTSTWWLVGRTFDASSGARPTSLIPSLDDGLTWNDSSALTVKTSTNITVKPRDVDSFGTIATVTGNEIPYLRAGLAGKYKDGVILVGGVGNAENPGAFATILRSTNDGVDWSTVSGEFTVSAGETAYFNLDNSSVWIATGSSAYRTLGVLGTNDDTDTIKYSINQGQTWSNAIGQFNRFGYEVAHGGNTWLATGIDKVGPSFFINLRYSTDGSNWALADLSDTNLFGSSFSFSKPALPLGSMSFDGTHWNVFVRRPYPVLTETYYTEMYRHDIVSSLASNWTRIDLSDSYFPEGVEPLLNFTQPRYLLTADGTIEITLSFPSQALLVGPTITSPTQTSYLVYQYIPITPIQIEATGTGFVYFFVETDELPPGLSFDPLTNQLSGTPAQIGKISTTIYAKDDVGTTAFTLTFTSIIARIIQKQEGAGAYTSLLRQYTEVLGAQGARDNRALPNQERALGEFMSPEGPDVITQTIDPKCRNPNC